VEEADSFELPQCGLCPHAGMRLRLETAHWRNNFEGYYADEGLGGREARYPEIGPKI